MKVYLAARYSLNPRLREFAAYLRARGEEVTSRWINGSHEINDHPSDKARQRLAEEDMQDLIDADVMISFSEPPLTATRARGGRHVEFGLAIAWGKRIIVVGPKENVFHYLPGIEHVYNEVEAAHAVSRTEGGK